MTSKGQIVLQSLFDNQEAFKNFPNAAAALTSEVLGSRLVLKSGEAFRATGKALYLWGEVALILGGPPARKWWRWQQSLDARGLYIEAGVVVLILFIYAVRSWLKRKQFGRRIRRSVRDYRRAARNRYNRLSEYVEHKSRVAALALPHVIYLMVALGSIRLFPSLGSAITHEHSVAPLQNIPHCPQF